MGSANNRAGKPNEKETPKIDLAPREKAQTRLVIAISGACLAVDEQEAAAKEEAEKAERAERAERAGSLATMWQDQSAIPRETTPLEIVGNGGQRLVASLSG